MTFYDFYLRYWRVYAGWFPVQACMVCGRLYWGGLPRIGLQSKDEQLRDIPLLDRPIVFLWQACWSDYCSMSCCNIDSELIKSMNQ